MVNICTPNGTDDIFNISPERIHFRKGHHVHHSPKPIRQIKHNTNTNGENRRLHQFEPQSASLIFTDTLTAFDEYLSKHSGRLFFHPNVHIVIVVSHNTRVVDHDLAAHIMQTLWKEFWTVHAFIVFICDSEEVCMKLIMRKWYIIASMFYV